MEFKDALRALMEKHQLRDVHIALISDSAVSTVHKWLAGKFDPHFSVVRRICKKYPDFVEYFVADEVSA